MNLLQRADARAKAACLLVYVIATLHASSALALGLCCLAALVAGFAARLSARDVLRTLAPFAVILVFTAVMQVLVVEQGDVLARVGPVTVTAGALRQAGFMVVSLVCVMCASVAFMRCTPTDELVHAFGWFARPLRAVGLRTDALVLSLNVAFRFVPVIVGEFFQLRNAQRARLADFEGSVRQRLRAYTRLFAPLVRSAFRRADVLAESFVARCFGSGANRTKLREHAFGWRDIVCLSVSLCLLAVSFA